MAHLSVDELSDLCDAMMDRMNCELLPAIAKANREDTLDELLTLLGMRDLLDYGTDSYENQFLGKIVVLGASEVSVDRLRGIVRKSGLDPNRFEFQLDYKKLKHYDFGKIRGAKGYIAILAGPMPHSTPGAMEASSFISRVEKNPDDYPILIKLQTGNDLKITNNSFKNALSQLLNIGYVGFD